MWELLSENADSMKLKCFAEMSSFRWKFTTGSTSSRNLPCLLLICRSVSGFQDLCLILLESLEMLILHQNKKFQRAWVSWKHGISELRQALLHPPRWLSWTKRHKEDGQQSVIAKDKAVEHSLSHIFLPSWEDRAGKQDFQWENGQIQQFHGLGW